MYNKKCRITGGVSRYLFILPAMCIYLCVVVIPAIYSFFLSFFKWNGVSSNMKFVGLQNYLNVITKDAVFKVAARNNVVWILLTLFFTVTISLCFALLINRQFYGRVFMRGILYFPYILSGIVVAITWNWIYQPQLGLLNSVFNAIGAPELSRAWLGDEKTAFIAVFIAALWNYTGAPMMLFLAGLQTIPKDLQEAAHIDGANKFQSFYSVTIPMLRETFVIVLATQIINSMKVYDIIFAMTGGGPAESTQTLATWMVTQTFTFANVGTGTAISWIMILVMMIIVIPYVLYMARDEVGT